MAGDWIKFRYGLIKDPKTIAIARFLIKDRDFNRWATEPRVFPAQPLSIEATVHIASALLCVTWSWSREHGCALPNGDCLLSQILVSDLDQIGGAPNLGSAMQSVGWAEQHEPTGVILPKFFTDKNIPPKTRAEIQADYRSRSVTKALHRSGNESVTREEKRRVEKKEKKTPLPPLPDSLLEMAEDWSEWVTYRSRKGKPISPQAAARCFRQFETWGISRARAAIDHTIANDWQGLREPDDAKRNGRRTGTGDAF